MTKFRASIALLVVLLGTVALTAQQAPVRGQMPDLGRPTRGNDSLPLFDFDAYFLGTWKFDWDVPDGPLGPAGRISGTTTYRALAAGFYEARTEAAGPAGPVRVDETIAYRRDYKTLARAVADSRGFSFLQIGPIGGDLGGYYNIYFESAPFRHNGKLLRVKTAMHLVSPLNYRVATTLSEDGGPFMNYGTTWWRKNVTQ
jgi:hypothetical protein